MSSAHCIAAGSRGGAPTGPLRVYGSSTAIPGGLLCEVLTTKVWRGSPMEVTNSQEPSLLGHLAIAGYSKALWELPKDQLPPTASAKHGKVVAGFYQVHKDHVEALELLERYLADASGAVCPLAGPPRRRVVILIEVERPDFLFGNVDRFRKRKAPKKEARRRESQWISMVFITF